MKHIKKYSEINENVKGNPTINNNPFFKVIQQYNKESEDFNKKYQEIFIPLVDRLVKFYFRNSNTLRVKMSEVTSFGRLALEGIDLDKIEISDDKSKLLFVVYNKDGYNEETYELSDFSAYELCEILSSFALNPTIVANFAKKVIKGINK